jgi:hypothetical protein
MLVYIIQCFPKHSRLDNNFKLMLYVFKKNLRNRISGKNNSIQYYKSFFLSEIKTIVGNPALSLKKKLSGTEKDVRFKK